MALYPEVQKRAQEEIDHVIGTDRLPTLADKDKLPYINAVVKEVLRWNVVAPTGILNLALELHYRSNYLAGIPHRLMKDDIQDGYLVPEGSTVIVNIQ